MSLFDELEIMKTANKDIRYMRERGERGERKEIFEQGGGNRRII